MNTWGVVGVQIHNLKVADLKSYGSEAQIAAVLNSFRLTKCIAIVFVKISVFLFYWQKKQSCCCNKILTTNVQCYEEFPRKKWD